MDLEEFRRHGHALVDWMADYLASVERYPVRAQVRPGEIAAPAAGGAARGTASRSSRSSPTSSASCCPA